MRFIAISNYLRVPNLILAKICNYFRGQANLDENVTPPHTHTHTHTHTDYYTALMAVCAHKSVTRREGLVSCARLLLNKGAKVNTYDR